MSLAVMFKPVSFSVGISIVSSKNQALTRSISITVVTIQWPAWEWKDTDEHF